MLPIILTQYAKNAHDKITANMTNMRSLIETGVISPYPTVFIVIKEK
jgi:hypothetical protein